MYNVEKYIGACLESLLAQTFQDFEVIVVDNGSTDNSPAILESYVEKFGERLRTFRIEKNSGSPALAYNKAISISRGKYVYVFDSDDLIVKNTLEILYNYAEKSNAEVVNMAHGYLFFSDTEKPFPSNENVRIINWTPFNSQAAMFETDNIGVRVQNICKGLVGRTAWQKFVLRDLLIENNITFLEKIRTAMDTVWAIQVFCCAKKILTIPEPLHIYREVANSVSHKKKTSEENIPNIMNSMIIILNSMEKFFDSQNFFQENPQYRWALLNYLENACFGDLRFQTPNIPQEDKFFNLLENEFEKNFGTYGAVIAYFCTASQFSRERLKFTSRRTFELENKLKQLQGG